MAALAALTVPLTACAQGGDAEPGASDAAAAQADGDAPASAHEPPRWRYVVGVSTAFAPDAVQHVNRWKVQPLWAVRVGRVRIATARAAALLAFGTTALPEAGASADVFTTGDLTLRAALRYDEGRDESGSVDQRPGLPEVRPTLRVRLALNKALTPTLGASVNVTQDILGRDLGATLGADLARSHKVSAATEWGLGAGVAAADTRYMQAHFGLSADQAAQGGWTPHTPGAGLRDVHVSTGLTTALTPTWLAYAQIGVTRLIGPAAQSPLVRDTLSARLTFGVAWRCCGSDRQ